MPETMSEDIHVRFDQNVTTLTRPVLEKDILHFRRNLNPTSS